MNGGVGEHLLRLDVLRFPLIVLVVYIHAAGFTANFADGARGLSLTDARTVESAQAMVVSVARVAVPLFFLMSGFLFFRGVAFSLSAYRIKLRSRVRSLLIPFLFWNIALLALIAIAQSIPGLAPFFNSQNLPVRDMSPLQLIDSIFGFTRYPIAYQFWFIRDLMILVVASPLVWLAARFIPWLALLVLAGTWLALYWPLLLPEGEPVLFFYLGALVAIRGGSLFAVDRISWWIAPLFLLGLFIIYASHGTKPLIYILRPTIAVGLVLALKASQVLARSERWSERLVWLGGTAFFIFAVHEPLVTTGKKIAFRFLPLTAGTIMTVYALLPMVIIAFAVGAYWLLSKTTPRLLSAITGGR